MCGSGADTGSWDVSLSCGISVKVMEEVSKEIVGNCFASPTFCCIHLGYSRFQVLGACDHRDLYITRTASPNRQLVPVTSVELMQTVEGGETFV